MADTPISPIPSPPPTTFAIGTISAGTPRLEYTQSLVHTLNTTFPPHLKFTDWLVTPSGPYLDDARNKVVSEFLQTSTAEWLLFIDDDIAWNVDDLVTLFAAADKTSRPIIGGAYASVSTRNGKFIVAYTWDDGEKESDDLADRVALVSMRVDDEGDDIPFIPIAVDAIGTGFLAIHRSVFATFLCHWGQPSPWFFEPNLPDGQGGATHFGEDLGFCIRAATLGYPIYLHGGVRLTHYKTGPVTI